MIPRLTPNDLAAWRRALREDRDGEFDTTLAHQLVAKLMVELEMLWASATAPEPSWWPKRSPPWRAASRIWRAVVRRTRRATGASTAVTLRRARSSPTCARWPRRRSDGTEPATTTTWCAPERYTGRFIWNRRQWYRDPLTKRRRYRDRPENEWVVTEQPALAIIDADTWAKVQAMNAARKNKKHRAPGPAVHEHMLSGMLRCGQCGSPMSIVSRVHKNGRAWANYGCSARHQKGDAICSNSRTISELRIDRTLLTKLRTYAESPEFDEWIDNGIAAAKTTKATDTDDELPRLQSQVRSQERQVEKATDILFQVGVSDALKARLRTEEEKLRDFRAKLAAATPRQIPTTAREVSKHQVVKLLEEVSTVARKAPRRAGKVLATVIEPVVLRPVEKGYEGDVWLRRNDSAALSGGRVFAEQSCGGRI